jgi:hypothetical protein
MRTNEEKRIENILMRLEQLEEQMKPPKIYLVKNQTDIKKLNKLMNDHIKKGFIAEVFLRKIKE